eukprot:2411138-Alexandrium_andersonii.AAC.1
MRCPLRLRAVVTPLFAPQCLQRSRTAFARGVRPTRCRGCGSLCCAVLREQWAVQWSSHRGPSHYWPSSRASLSGTGADVVTGAGRQIGMTPEQL